MQSNQIKKLLRSMCVDGERINIDSFSIDWLIEAGLVSIAVDYGSFDLDDEQNKNKLIANNLNAKLWYQSQFDSTYEIVKKLNEIGIVPTLLKGISVSTQLYTVPHYRVMRDIDLLVDEKDLFNVEAILPELGYEQKSTYSPEFYQTLHHTMPWQHQTKKIWIEIHKKLFPRTSACYKSDIFQLDVIDSEKQKGDFQGLDVFYLSKEFQLVYIATHWAEKFKHIGGVFGLLDIALLINKHADELNWEKILLWSNTLYVSDYVYLVLEYLMRNSFIEPSTRIESHISSIAHNQSKVSMWILFRIIDGYIIEGRSFGRVLSINNVSILWQHLLEPGNQFKKIILIPAAIIFPKKSKYRFNLGFQYSRLITLLTGRRD